MNYILRTLPDSMSHIGDLIDVLEEHQQSTEYMKNKIKMLEIKEKNESENSRSNVFVFEKMKSEGNKKTCMWWYRSHTIRLPDEKQFRESRATARRRQRKPRATERWGHRQRLLATARRRERTRSQSTARLKFQPARQRQLWTTRPRRKKRRRRQPS